MFGPSKMAKTKNFVGGDNYYGGKEALNASSSPTLKPADLGSYEAIFTVFIQKPLFQFLLAIVSVMAM